MGNVGRGVDSADWGWTCWNGSGPLGQEWRRGPQLWAQHQPQPSRSIPVSELHRPALSCPDLATQRLLCQIQGHNGTFRCTVAGTFQGIGASTCALQHCVPPFPSIVTAASTVHGGPQSQNGYMRSIQTKRIEFGASCFRVPLPRSQCPLASKFHAAPARKSYLVGTPTDELPALQQPTGDQEPKTPTFTCYLSPRDHTRKA